MATIDHRLVAEALLKVETSQFEKFGQVFYSAIQDRDYIPLGGVQDGGADGFVDLLEDRQKIHFIQISKEQNCASKIRKTVKRLREYGRDPSFVTLITSQFVKDIDKLQTSLSRELSVSIAIRDGAFIAANINASASVRQAFQSYLEPSIEYLYRPGEIEKDGGNVAGVDRSLAVFLRQEVTNRRDNVNLTQSLTDSLIIWALRDTDPLTNILMTEDQILLKIIEILPTARSFILSTLPKRLTELSKKATHGGRSIRAYSGAPKRFCLPFQTRNEVAVQNAEDALLRHQTSCKLEERAQSANIELADRYGAKFADLCHAVLEKCFYEQGMNLVNFLNDNDTKIVDDSLDISVEIKFVVEEYTKDPVQRSDFRALLTEVMRGVFYRATEVERLYLGKLSRTYALLLLVRNEPRVVEYFSSMASSFELYVGTDMVIRALSEQFLDKANRDTENLFELLSASGSKLILTEKVVEEVASHLRRQVMEYENNYLNEEQFIQKEAIQFIDRLLIRAYLYAKMVPISPKRKPRSFRDYINNFADYDDIKNQRNWDQLGTFLATKFSFEYEGESEMMHGVDPEELENLTDQIFKVKNETDEKNRVLAYNDALQILRIYGKRIQNRESNPKSRFGYKTWWLTQDRKVRRGGQSAAEKRGGARFMMRPEFLLYYIGLNPKMSEIRQSFEAIMPTVLGIHLGGHVDSRVYKKLLRDVADIYQRDEARALAMMRTDSQSLLSDFGRTYS